MFTSIKSKIFFSVTVLIFSIATVLFKFENIELHKLEESNKEIPLQIVVEHKIVSEENCNKYFSLLPLSDSRWIKTKRLPRYDHITCQIMKARYNCAESQLQEKKETSLDWTLVLSNKNSSKLSLSSPSKFCDVQQFVESVEGGPFRAIASKNRSSSLKQKRPINVFIHGNSHFRQVFEAIACGFREHITDSRVSIGSKSMNKAAIERRKKRGIVLNRDDIGQLVNISMVGSLYADSHTQYDREDIIGCHGDNSDKSFSKELKPKSLFNCNDNIAMVEFNESVRIYYAFRHFSYKGGVTDIYDALDLEPDQIDYLIFNDKYDREISEKQINQYRRKVWNKRIYFEPIFGQAGMSSQKRDIGKWFGADNPGIDSKPDAHACMPGQPDDTANLILFSLLTGSKIIS